MNTEAVAAARRSLREGNVEQARRSFEDALRAGETGEALEGLAEALYLSTEYQAAAALAERAFTAYRTQGDAMAAGRAARLVAWVSGNVLGDWAVQNGWLARAASVLAEAGLEGPERGWLLIIESFGEPDLAKREVGLREAVAIGRRFGDANIEYEALSYLGGNYVLDGRAEEGLLLFDEALAAVCAGDTTEISVAEGIFCGFFWACELVNDVPRADQWTRAAADIMERNVVAAFCRAHYGGILTAAGRWDEAETELLEAARRFDRGLSSRRDAAIVRLADLRVRQGRLDEAAQLLDGLEQHPDAVRPLAALYLGRGETARARDLLERGTQAEDTAASVGESTMVGPLLSLLVDALLEEGAVDAADEAAQRLRRLADAQRGPYLHAAAALAEGQVCIATGAGDARACLHAALEGFARAQLPMELARARLAMARAMAERSPEVAIAEAKSALADFERLRAARLVDAAAAVLRELGAPSRTGPKGTGALTKREAEVLELLGYGLSNPEISDRLYISRKTVEHHVGSILSKLGLRNRAEAAAHAAKAPKISP